MIATLAFSIIAATLVLLAGRKDAARDPRLTVLLLLLLSVFPVLFIAMPKISVLPAGNNLSTGEGIPWSAILTGLWVAGFVFSMVRLCLAFAVLHGWRKRSILLSLHSGVEIRMLKDFSGPLAAGVFSPVIFVPASWSNWSDDYRHVVLTHELAHHRRRDPLWRMIAEFSCAVHWFNPLVRWMTNRLNMQCEYACDGIVLEQGVETKTYASVLCDFASPAPRSILTPAMAEQSQLESRIRRMFASRTKAGGMSLVILTLLGVLTACTLSMMGLKKPVESSVPASEVLLRLTADPFPGER